MEEKEIFYLCDGNKDCYLSKKCFVNNGTCKHTKDIRHAVSFSHTTDCFYGNQELLETIETYIESNPESEEIQENKRLLNMLLEEEKKKTGTYKWFAAFYIVFACIWVALMIAKVFL